MYKWYSNADVEIFFSQAAAGAFRRVVTGLHQQQIAIVEPIAHIGIAVNVSGVDDAFSLRKDPETVGGEFYGIRLFNMKVVTCFHPDAAVLKNCTV